MARGILVDFQTESGILTIAETDVDNLEAIYKVLRCSTITLVNIDQHHFCYIDDEGLINDKHDYMVVWDFYQQGLIGPALIFGFGPDGENADCTLSRDEVFSKIKSIYGKN